MTNFDKITRSPEALAEFLNKVVENCTCDGDRCEDCELDWHCDTKRGIIDYLHLDAVSHTAGADESEPADKPQTESAADYDYMAKSDCGKARLDLVPPEIIEAIGAVRTYGVKKYTDPQSWRWVEVERYRAALMRHLCKYLKEPQGVDEESRLPHLWHVAANVAFLVALDSDTSKSNSVL